MSGITCLSYKRALEEEKKLIEKAKQGSMEISNGYENQQKTELPKQLSGCPYANGQSQNVNGEGETVNETLADVKNEQSEENQPPAKKPRMLEAFTNAKIETVKENLKEQSLTVQQINEYCKDLFIFKNIKVMRFT